jgi:large subunit ribosomal protein L15
MKLHDLKPDKGSVTRKTRLGRGIAAGKGKTGGRGTKGQGSRGSSNKRQYFEGGQLPLVRRLPFRRGFNNLFKIYYQPVNLAELETIAAGTLVTPSVLESLGFIRDAEKPIVILGAGDLTKKLDVQAHRFSKSAAEKIAAAGGSTKTLQLLVTGANATVKKLSKEKLAALKEAQQQN